MTQEQVVAEIKKLSEYAGKPTPISPEDILEDIQKTSGFLGFTATLVAQAQWYLNKRQGAVSEELLKEFPKANQTTLTTILNGRTANEQATYKLIERVNAALVHRLDALRSQLSYEKEQLNRQ